MPRTLRVSVKATAVATTKKYTKRNKAYWAQFKTKKGTHAPTYKGATKSVKNRGAINIYLSNGDADKFALCFAKARGNSLVPVHIVDVVRVLMDTFLRA